MLPDIFSCEESIMQVRACDHPYMDPLSNRLQKKFKKKLEAEMTRDCELEYEAKLLVFFREGSCKRVEATSIPNKVVICNEKETKSGFEYVDLAAFFTESQSESIEALRLRGWPKIRFGCYLYLWVSQPRKKKDVVVCIFAKR
ncbi:unnamed protein product [Cylicocyclus nassatus]|uniref:Uncharacterized protein n=1 Tax=Cylicocyclus nassatus TaxID=53992 RepID=A0AA36DNZ1_CYLNA|nr:unnamed protein product [Cylicocyclus nassatus]